MRATAFVGALAVAAVASAAAGAATAPPPTVQWHAAWGRSQSPAPTAPTLTGQTARVIARVTGGGTAVRIRLQNAFGKSPTANGGPPVTVDAAAVGLRAAGPALIPGSTHPVTFGGRRSVTVAPGASVTSDAVALAVAPQQDVAISLHTPAASPPAHLLDTVTNYVSGPGDATADETGAAYVATTTSTPLAAELDVQGLPLAGTIVAIGGSVVDGVGSTLDGHDTWPDDLAERYLAEVPAAQRKTVVNAGIASTTAAAACASVAGPAAQDRLQRDALSISGVTDLILYAGTNDLAGTNEQVGGCTGDQIIAAYEDIVAQAHSKAVRVLVSTITPRAAYTKTENAYRDQVNAWVRGEGTCSGRCDAALDFDAAVRDPARPTRLDPALDSGDGVHPNPEGYRRIARSIDLAALGAGASPPAAMTVPALRVGLTARRVGRGYRLTASVRTTAIGTVRLSLHRNGRTVRVRVLTLRGGRAQARLDVRRAGRYRVTVSAGSAVARSASVRLARR